MGYLCAKVLLFAGLTACSAASGSDGGPTDYGGAGGSVAGSGGSSAGLAGNAGKAGRPAGGSGGAGATAGAGSAGGGASAGNGAGAVTFDWPETAPGTGTCKAGHYQGDFVGLFASSMTVFPAPIPVGGNVDLTLKESANGEFFEIEGGKVSGVADLLFPYEADIVGRLNCTTRKLENAALKNGHYLVGVFLLPFEGPLTADYDTLTLSFVNGTWDVKEPNPTYGGFGTWNAKGVP